MKKYWYSKLTRATIGYVVTLMLAACSCGNNNDRSKYMVYDGYSQQGNVKEVIEGINRYLSEKDKLIMEGYAKRHKLSMTLSEGGFYYQIIEEGKGKQVKDGSHVEITGRVSLIDGTLCYTYSAADPKTVVIEKSGDITGLHLALPMLKEGGRAIFIFPPHLAFGLLGDGHKIPPRSILVMDIELLSVDS